MKKVRFVNCEETGCIIIKVLIYIYNLLLIFLLRDTFLCITAFLLSNSVT